MRGARKFSSLNRKFLFFHLNSSSEIQFLVMEDLKSTHNIDITVDAHVCFDDWEIFGLFN